MAEGTKASLVFDSANDFSYANKERVNTRYFLQFYLFAVTRSAILSYSAFGMMWRVTSSPGSL
jgi:hypothetical protein